MTVFGVATFNLYQFCAPGRFWYEAERANTYTDPEWAAKRDFVRRTIAALDAEIIAFQEVFSPENLRGLLADEGYPHVAWHGEPAADAADPTLLRAPLVAVASRHPITRAEPVAPPPGFAPAGLLAEDFTFRRDVLEVEIPLPGLARPLVVLACHLKSQGAFVDRGRVAAEPDWTSRYRAYLAERARLDAAQVIRRSGEALMLYTRVMDLVAARPGLPVIVTGDLNDTPDSTTLRILTQSDPAIEVGGVLEGDVAAEDKARGYDWRLYSTDYLVPKQMQFRSPTHVMPGISSTLDHILVSNALNPRNPRAIASPLSHDVFDRHHLEGAPARLTSDHAPVRARFEVT